MATELDHDYINYLADKWRNYLLKKDPHDLVRKARYEEVMVMIYEMREETKTGKMLYDFFFQLHHKAEGEVEAYEKYLEGGSI